MKIRLAALLLLIGPLLASAHATDFSWPGHGTITVDVPAQWVLAARPAGDDSFYFKAKPESRTTAQLQVTLIDTRPERPVLFAQLKEELRSLVQPVLADSVEKEFSPQELRLQRSQGWLVQLTDANLVGKPPTPDDYKVMRSALLCLDDHALVHVTMQFDDASVTEPAVMLELLASLRFIRIAKNGELAPTQAAGHFEFTAPDSRLLLRIPADGWVQDLDKISGSLTHARHFMLSREEPNLILRGWFEPSHRSTSLQDFLASESDARKEAGLPSPQNPEFLKIGNWEIIAYDLPLPAADGTNRHLRAQLTRAGTWIDLHLSSTSPLTATAAREQLLTTLRSIQITEK